MSEKKRPSGLFALLRRRGTKGELTVERWVETYYNDRSCDWFTVTVPCSSCIGMSVEKNKITQLTISPRVFLLHPLH